MSPETGEPSGLLQFRFDTDAAELDANALQYGGGLQWRQRGGHWTTRGLRKGQDSYFATQGDWSMGGIRQAVVTDQGMSFRLRMGIRGKGDMWISDDQNTGSIRMRDSENDRARLVAVRRGPDESLDDPFGTEQNFPVYTFDELVNI
ncbi:hypothetical protein [Streptomyces sp. NBC_01435]|uniref:hypothetical protein n=1 Tax=Streptomyces sp. NBC_01435 TaxID=2903865 RepID=UPI002E36CC45|nr:hypothetical protein [Streptomyces sp. NBC_01435]